MAHKLPSLLCRAPSKRTPRGTSRWPLPPLTEAKGELRGRGGVLPAEKEGAGPAPPSSDVIIMLCSPAKAPPPTATSFLLPVLPEPSVSVRQLRGARLYWPRAHVRSLCSEVCAHHSLCQPFGRIAPPAEMSTSQKVGSKRGGNKSMI